MSDTSTTPDPPTSLWLTTEGTGCIHYSCGPGSDNLGQRYVNAKVAIRYDVGECCESHTSCIPCAFDVFGDIDTLDQQAVLSYALARAEGRPIDPPYRCAVHGGLTFGGCCQELHNKAET